MADVNDDGTRENVPVSGESTAEAADGAAESLIQKPNLLEDRRPGGVLNRRRFLIAGAATGVGAASVTLGTSRSQDVAPATPADTPGEAVEDVATVTGEHAGMQMQPAAAETTTVQGFTVFVPFEASIVQAAAARLIPTDELGPGATEAGVVYFIDRQLQAQEQSHRGYRGQQYMLGPFQPGAPTQGDQSGMPVRDRFRLGIRGMEAYAQQVYGRGFVALTPEEQDRILADMEAGVPENFDGVSVTSYPVTPAPAGQEATEQAARAGVGATAFFDLLLAFTFAGFFSDPVQGGNRDMVGWKLIGFPGAHIGYPEEILRYGEPYQGDYISLAQYQQQVSGGV